MSFQVAYQFFIEQDAYNKTKEREEVLKKLINSQEVYIKELESKYYDLESEMKFLRNSKPQENTDAFDKTNHREGYSNQAEDQVRYL